MYNTECRFSLLLVPLLACPVSHLLVLLVYNTVVADRVAAARVVVVGAAARIIVPLTSSVVLPVFLSTLCQPHRLHTRNKGHGLFNNSSTKSGTHFSSHL